VMAVDAAGVAVLAALGAAVYLTGIAPTRAAALSAVEQRQQLETQQLNLKDARDHLAESGRKRAKLREDAAKAPRVGAEDPNQRIRAVSEIASKHGVTITELTPKAEVPGTRFKRLPIAVAGVGSAVSFEQVFADLHAAFPDTEVTNLSITGTPDSPTKMATFRAEVVWYALADLPNKAAPAGRTAGSGN
jgi:hypothetical protein